MSTDPVTTPEPTTPLPSVIVYAYGLLYLSACTVLENEATAARVNAEYPTGISSAWSVHDGPFSDGSANPSPCNEHAGRRHVLFSC